MTSTIPDAPDLGAERRGRALRRVALAVIGLFVLAGLTGQLGVRSRTTSGRDGALTASLTYPHVARPALAIPYRLAVHVEGGTDEQVEVRISSAYLDSFDENGREPEPAETTTDADDVIWTFDPPDGEDLTLTLDTRVEPGVQWRRPGRTVVTVGDDEVVLDHDMWVLP